MASAVRRGATSGLPGAFLPQAARVRAHGTQHSVPRPSARLLASGASGGRGVWAFLDAVQGKTLIGKDQHGNTYWEVANPGRKPDPIREIDYAEKHMVSLLSSCLCCCLALVRKCFS
jgi:hypothetical protein